MRVVALLLVAGCLLAAGCSRSGESDGRPRVVATTTQAGDLVGAVGGNAIAVHPLLRANADPHEYEPRPSDVRALSGAALVVRSGGDVDDWLDRVLEGAGGHAVRLTLIDRVPKQTLHGRLDP